MSRPLHRLAQNVTKEEEAFGFGASEPQTGIRAVVRELPSGLRVVKMQTEDGTTEYAICDEQFRPLYQPAKSLDELRRRFGPLPA